MHLTQLTSSNHISNRNATAGQGSLSLYIPPMVEHLVIAIKFTVDLVVTADTCEDIGTVKVPCSWLPCYKTFQVNLDNDKGNLSPGHGNIYFAWRMKWALSLGAIKGNVMNNLMVCLLYCVCHILCGNEWESHVAPSSTVRPLSNEQVFKFHNKIFFYFQCDWWPHKNLLTL